MSKNLLAESPYFLFNKFSLSDVAVGAGGNKPEQWYTFSLIPRTSSGTLSSFIFHDGGD